MKTFNLSLLFGVALAAAGAANATVQGSNESDQDYLRYVFTYDYEPGMDNTYQAYSRAEQQIEHRLNQDIRTQALTSLYEMASDELYASANHRRASTVARAD
ncbi:hypothetical protein HMF8227_00996 [Saliniradius amylolyticus]|uniref:Uncharacterized protein n=2 Tax=Saliniradius amylolyticus TaxID=2183582 RepID=A0A2S2E1L8_9ALTE|nr:hypothetical protein HMF8227_00996 [Saliniradius amylolyticus]